MIFLKAETPSAFKNADEKQQQLETRRLFLNRQIGMSFLDLDKTIAFQEGFELDGLSLRQTDDGWMLILKGCVGARAYVAFLGAQSFAGALQLAAELAETGGLAWVHDKYPSKRVVARRKSF